MEVEQLQTLIAQTDWKETVATIKDEKTEVNHAEYKKGYDVDLHDSVDIATRPDKIIYVKDAENRDVPQTVNVARLGTPFQKRIVKLAASFLCGNPIQLYGIGSNEAENNLLKVLKKAWDDSKLDYESKTIAKILFSETEVAEIWYSEKAEADFWDNTPIKGAQSRLRMKLICKSKGDDLYPVYNTNGDMIAFGRGYTIEKSDTKEEHFDLYTPENIFMAVKAGEDAWVTKSEANPFKKIPVIYYSQERPDWWEVRSLIDRFEKILSNHADTNDYFGSPMVIVKGEIKSFSKKGESGKILELADGAEASYMTWDQSPESAKLEFENLRSLILNMTDTPDISFESMKGLGTLSGIALKMLFLGAHMKAADHEENFGKSVQRRINFLKSALITVSNKLEKASSLAVRPKFEYYLPKDTVEMIDLLTTATNQKQIMSQKTAVSLNPLIENKEAELDLIKEDEKNEASLNAAQNNLP